MLGSDDEMNLHLYHTDSLFGMWSAHENKRVMMCTEARPGGWFIEMEDIIYIPIQNSTKGYGMSLYKFEYKDGNYDIERAYPLHMRRQIRLSKPSMLECIIWIFKKSTINIMRFMMEILLKTTPKQNSTSADRSNGIVNIL